MKGAKENPRLKIINGEWHAERGRGLKKTVNLLLVPAIGLCKQLNMRRAKARRKDLKKKAEVSK
jgi:hypothetical protein